MRRLPILLAVVLLLAVPVATGWTQMRGGPERPSMLPLDPDPVDVLASLQLLQEGERLGGLSAELGGPGLVLTPHGLTGVAYGDETGACVLLHLPIDALGEPPERTELDQCQRGSLQAYGVRADLLLVCSEGSASDPVFQARDALTGEMRFSVGPADVQPILTDQLQIVDRSVNASPAPWRCGGTALDQGTQMAAVAFAQADPSERTASAINHAVAGVGLVGGGMVWAHRVSPETFRAGEAILDIVAGDQRSASRGGEAPGNFFPTGMTMTESGWIVNGILSTGSTRTISASQNEVAAAWGTEDRVVGGVSSETSAYWTDRKEGGANNAGGSLRAAARGPLGAFVMDDWVVVVNPGDQVPLRSARVAQLSGEPGNLWGTAPVWTRDTLIAPMRESLTAVDGFDLTARWPWGKGPDQTITDMGVSAAGYLYVLAGQRYRGPQDIDAFYPLREDATGLLTILDMDDGRVIQEVPTPAAGPMDDPRNRGAIFPPALVPIRQGLVGLITADGQLTFVGQAPEKETPIVSPDAAYPGPGRPVTLQVTPRGNEVVEEMRVAWGDGAVDRLTSSAPLVHTYTGEGDHTIYVTLVHRDGTTRTGETTVHVGGQPQTLVQTAFAPENQDTTWGIIGVTVAVLGGLFGFARVHRRRNRLQDELATLERVYEATSDDPPACEATLEERRAHARGLLLNGKLDEAQFAVVEGRIGELQRGLRNSALDERFEFLPHGMVVALRDMLSDGRISAWEREHVLRVLEEDEVLTDDQKIKVRGLVDRWFRHDAGVAP